MTGDWRPIVAYLDRSKSALFEPAVVHQGAERDSVTVEAAMQWTDSYHETVLCLTNNIPQRDGGTHLAGFRAALTRGRSTTMRRAPGWPRRTGSP